MRMANSWMCFLLLASVYSLRADEPPAPTQTLVRLSLSPKAAPRPSLKYQLLPRLSELRSGNSVHGFLKCFAEQNSFFFSKEANAERDKLREMPLSELRKEKYVPYGGSALRRADDAALLDRTDWQILPEMQRDGFYTLLPEVQQLRLLADCLRIRLRQQIAHGRYEEALVTARTMLRLGQTMKHHPTLIAQLVGLAMTHLTLTALEEMIAQPDAPNLYWALSYLPDPLFDLRAGFDGELLMAEVELGRIAQEPMTPESLKQVIERFEPLLNQGHEPNAKQISVLDRQLTKLVEDKKRLDQARHYLREIGLAESRLDALPARQLLLLESKYRFREQQEDLVQWLILAYPVAESRMQLKDGKPSWPTSAEFEKSLFAPIMTHAFRVRQVQVRIQQRLALLRLAEAVRLHAAKTGKLPDALRSIEVPVPVDPVTGKAFTYEIKDGIAQVHGAVPKGQEKQPAFRVRYELTLRKLGS
ncbi:MAG: hypothetical protein SNJ75_16800 [Gemmataceae bacterium]